MYLSVGGEAPSRALGGHLYVTSCWCQPVSTVVATGAPLVCSDTGLQRKEGAPLVLRTARPMRRGVMGAGRPVVGARGAASLVNAG